MSNSSNPPPGTEVFFGSNPPPGSFDPEKTFNKSLTVFVVVAVLGVASSIFVAVLIYKYFNKHGFPSLNFITTPPPAAAPPAFPSIMNEQTTVERFLHEIAREKPIRFLSQQLQAFTRNYSTKLGSGGFGSVYKGELPNGVPVAVKVLVGHLDKRDVEEQFMAEVGTIGRTYHINLVKLYGFCFDAAVRAVYEYMENGSLDKHLHEECQQRIIHYDIKPGNILLDSEYFNPKVAEFGLAKLMNRENTHISVGGRGTPGYAAPEMWMPSPVTHKCDVYSFGMLLFEIVGRRRNLDVTATESQQWFPKMVYEKFEGGLLAEVVSSHGIEEENREKAEVALWCVQYSAEARPPMSKVVKMLEGEMEIAPPMNPFQHLYTSGAGSNLWNDGGSDQSASTGYSETTPIMRRYEIEIATK